MKIVITGGVASAAENPSLNSKRTVGPIDKNAYWWGDLG